MKHRLHSFYLTAFLLILMIPVLGFSNKTLQDSLFLQKKSYQARKAIAPPKIDGKLIESFWLGLPVAGDFVVYAPLNGSVSKQRTEVRMAFDNEAFYIGATMFDPHPEKICKELGKRDQVELLNTDYISFDLLPYNDGLNMYEFKVTPSNLQNDCKYSAIGVDINWDAVWESAVTINDSAWVAEVRIPWSALRFPKIPEQLWGFNLWRNFHREHEYSTWTYVDIKDQDIFKYYGTITGIHKINPPVRLSVTPYVAAYLEKNPDKSSWQYSTRGGLDLRYGINESYTLDMMLIPDFGQVQSDDVILNLTPFEVRYDEKRQFFTEATELFNKCGIFYSRRIGSTPRNYFAPYFEAGNNEEIIKNPDETRIINATKISGRNSKGLGVGFFNAMTSPSEAELFDSTSNTRRKIRTQSFTNYNVLVVDQNLKNNSYATIINTHYWIPDSKYLANVSGLETRLNTPSRSFSFMGRLNISQVYNRAGKPEIGSNYMISVSRPKGKFQYELRREAMDTKYNPNDMGYISNNNEASNVLRLSHLIFDPIWKFQSMQSDIQASYTTLSNPKDFISMRLYADNLVTFKNYWSNYIDAGLNPKGITDYYEARSWGWIYKRPLNYDMNWRIASDARKAFRLHNSLGITHAPSKENFAWYIETIERMRFSDRFSITVSCMFQDNFNDYGWADTRYDTLMNPSIYFGRRDITTISNVLNIKYIFNTKASLNLRGRHYWSRVEYLDFYKLEKDGQLSKTDFDLHPSQSFNAFTADLQLVWYFAPGSEISFVWKNSIHTSDENIRLDYREDFRNTITAPQANSFSVRVLYYLDYQTVRKLIDKNS